MHLPDPFIKYSGFVFLLSLPVLLMGETKTWTGYGGDLYWSNSLNWSGGSLPGPTDDILLDNGDLPVSYQVILPDGLTVVQTLRIRPSPGHNIELVLPVTNTLPEAFSVTGPGYGIAIYAGGIFRNASGIASGESLRIADSIIIYDGGRYIHQTRGAHANSILKWLSAAPGTEQGIFDFDVPRASYTISLSNRIYGSLELHATALGAPVNYTGTGSNPLTIRGNLRIGVNVNLSLDLKGANGNIQVGGDFIQEGGQLNLAAGMDNQTILRISGDLYQSSQSAITETGNGNPWIELNGNRPQEIAMSGELQNQLGVRLNNVRGADLHLPFLIPWKLELLQGAIFSSPAATLVLKPGCLIIADSSRTNGAYVDGPLRKMGLSGDNHFLFPVGKNGKLRWLEIKNAVGDFTVTYFPENPVLLESQLGPGLDHISKMEYWTIMSNNSSGNSGKVELSFAAGISGSVTDPEFLNIAKLQSGQWSDGGHSSATGNVSAGSVVGSENDFTAVYYTLASTLNLENPLPLTSLDLQLKEWSGELVFTWNPESTETPDHFDILQDSGRLSKELTAIKAINGQKTYSWSYADELQEGLHYFWIRMTDIHGREYLGNKTAFRKTDKGIRVFWISNRLSGNGNRLMVFSEKTDLWKYEILSVAGQKLESGEIRLTKGENRIALKTDRLRPGIYIFRSTDASAKIHSLVIPVD